MYLISDDKAFGDLLCCLDLCSRLERRCSGYSILFSKVYLQFQNIISDSFRMYHFSKLSDWAGPLPHANFPVEKSYHANTMSFWRYNVELHKVCGILKTISTKEVHHSNLCSRKWRRQTKTRRTDQQFNFVFRQDWRLSTRFANLNQQKVTSMFLEDIHIIGMLDVSTVARIIYLVGGRSIRIAEMWNPRMTASTVTGDASY